ncbi:MAG TPA: hypothetical protein VID68_07840 [Solirubrobacteraceae bacterium]|jgi:hypothetical protein
MFATAAAAGPIVRRLSSAPEGCDDRLANRRRRGLRALPRAHVGSR